MTSAVKQLMLSRRAVMTLILVLVLALVALIAALLMIGGGSQATSHGAVAGIRPLLVITGPGVGRTPLFDRPMGAAFGKDGRIYVADTGDNRVVTFDRNGRYLYQFGGLGVGKPARGGTYSWKPGLMNYPTDVATDVNGDVFVADFGNDQIEVFSADGRYLRAFPNRKRRVGKGASGKDGKGIADTSLTIANGRVYATDTYQVVAFTTDGKFIRQFGKPGLGATDLDHPNGIAIGADASVIVSDSDHNRVLGLTPSGKLLWSVGVPHSIDASAVSQFEVPRGLATLPDGTYLVSDALASRLVKVSSSGKVLGAYGRRGGAPGEFNFPTDVAAGPGARLLVAEKGNNRVQVVLLEK